MSTRRLLYLATLAEEEHFGRAAEKCNVSQPTLSSSIRQFEEDLDIQIVKRGHRFSGFTQEGLRVLDYAKRVLAEDEKLVEDINFMRTQVGDRYIMERLKREGGVLGGEPSGHIICRDRTSTGDGIVVALQVLTAMKDADRDLGDLAGEMRKYPQRLINIRLDEQRNIIGLPEVRDAVGSAERELGEYGRVLLRPSGTEPLIRVMVEGGDEAQVASVADRLADVVRARIAG